MHFIKQKNIIFGHLLSIFVQSLTIFVIKGLDMKYFCIWHSLWAKIAFYYTTIYLLMWSFYFRSAIRSISRKRLFSAFNIAGLAIGICLFFLSLEFYNYNDGFNRFHPRVEHLFRVGIADAEGRSAATFPTIAPLMQQYIPGVQLATRYADNFNDGAIISWQPLSKDKELSSFREEGCVFVDKAFLDAFHFPLISGTNGLDETNTVILTASAAAKLFGNDAAVGKVINLHNQFGNLPVKVVGVTADIPDQSDIKFRYLLSIHILDDPKYIAGSDWAKLTTWGNNSYTTYVRLVPNADPAEVSDKATRLWKQYDPEYTRKNGSIFLQPVADMHLGSGWKDNNPSYASFALNYTVLALGILILCIAWINYINFATADALIRAKETGIHKIVGGSRIQIAMRSVAESMLLNLAGLFAAFILTQLVQGLFNYITQKPLSIHYINNAPDWMLASAILGGGSLLCGGYTGFLLSNLKPMNALHLNDRGKFGHSLVRKGLVTVQLTVACFFIAVTLVAYRQVGYMKNHDLGMDITQLGVVEGPVIRDSTFKSNSVIFRNEVAHLPFVERFTGSGSVPGIGSGHNFSADGITGSNSRQGEDKTAYSISEIDQHFFDTYRIPLLQGNNFNETDVEKGFKTDRLIINETAAKTLGYSSSTAVGKVIKWGKVYTIAAVARDYHHRSLKEPIEPIIYIPAHNSAYYTIKVTAGTSPQKLSAIQTLYERLYPGNSYTFKPLHDTYAQVYAEDQRTGVIAGSLSILVIVISGLGLAGLAAFTARRRTKEIGIRKLLGASIASIFFQLCKEYCWLVMIAFLLATPISKLITYKWLQGFAFRIEPGWGIFMIAGFLCLCVTVATISFHALRAAYVNPIRQLRTE